MMTWAEICEDPSLQNLPYKIETNRWGQIVMSPAKRWHSKRQGLVSDHLSDLKESGFIYTELALITPVGVKVMDVAWCSDEFDAAHEHEDTLTAAPEVCVEVISESNSGDEIEEKRMLYFAHGAKEVWLCDSTGKMSFYLNASQPAERSGLFSAFPSKV